MSPLQQWLFECFEARSLLSTTKLWPHTSTSITPVLYPEIPALLLSPLSTRLTLGLLSEEEWRLIPGLFTKQIPTKARDLAKIICISTHGQWLLRNDSIFDKETIEIDSLNPAYPTSPAHSNSSNAPNARPEPGKQNKSNEPQQRHYFLLSPMNPATSKGTRPRRR